jgi:hypothetical protein
MLKMNLSRWLAILVLLMFFILLGIQFFFGEATSGFWAGMIDNFAVILGWGGVALTIIPFFMLIIVIKIYLTETGHEYKYSLSANFEALPNELIVWEQELQDLGFSRFGTYTLTHDTVGHKTWVYLDESKMISAESHLYNDGTYNLELSSNYADGFSVNTFYKVMFEAENERAAIRYFMNSITAAFDYHSSQLEGYAIKHGKVRHFKELEDFIVSPEARLKIHRSLGITMMKKFGSTMLAYLAYVLLGLSSSLLVSSMGEYVAAWIFFTLAALLLWFVDILSILKIFQSVEERKPRKSAS